MNYSSNRVAQVGSVPPQVIILYWEVKNWVWSFFFFLPSGYANAVILEMFSIQIGPAKIHPKVSGAHPTTTSHN